MLPIDSPIDLSLLQKSKLSVVVLLNIDDVVVVADVDVDDDDDLMFAIDDDIVNTSSMAHAKEHLHVQTSQLQTAVGDPIMGYLSMIVVV